MSDLPTLRPRDVAVESVYCLGPSAQYVVGHPSATEKGKVLIWTQHRDQGAAEARLKALARSRHLDPKTRKALRVYRVAKEEV